MANNVLLQLAGALLLGVLAFEVFITAMTMRGSGPLTGALARVLWSVLLAAHRIRPRHGLLSFAGGAIAAMTLVLWVLTLWMGWGLIFAGAPGSIVNVQSGLGADLPSRFYFAGFNIFTLGVGDFRPVGALWQFMTILASASGLVAVTLAITYLLPILSQAVSRQALAGRIGLFGDTPAGIAADAWSQGPQTYAGRLEGLAPDILQQGRQHLAYPVLHYFHTTDPRLATAAFFLRSSTKGFAMKFRPKSLDQQTLVITGASSGIGLTTAREAVAAGAAVVLVARNEEALKTITNELRAQGGRVAYAVADVGVQEDIEGVVQTALSEFGGFDTWVNDAGVGIYGDLMDIPIDEHERLFQTNYWGVVFGSRAAVQHFRTAGGGTLINIGSINSDFAIPLLSAYAASKHAVKGFTDGLRMELRHDGTPVSVTLIKPSGIGTPFPVHARNHMESDPQVAPPVYAPEVVARAILHAATHQVRDITVGASGRMMVGAAVSMPKLADRFFAWSMPKVQKTGKPRTEADSLFSPSEDGDMYRTDKGPGRKFSVYTSAQEHPKAVTAAGLGLAAVGAGAAMLVARRLSNRRALPRRAA